ncbi:uncharacterized protein SOCEGT47_016930 [Sorangium cellulosum]|uniref:Uncharacterized protein n=1 Tax=Sorangium cellulosum TaxID=56 RepID=A0A4P2PWP3_SORCE|nr:hypothetical protein [Sorangium cellulosum]AUX21214.1 uncharacterized protein SOCEGT47_016930 [Sorangium cellulosum]
MLVALAIACAGLASPACSKSPQITAERIEESGALTEQHEPGSVVMTVAPDGQVTVLVKDSDGKPIEEGVSGTLTVKAPGGGEAPLAVELAPRPGSGGLLVAKLPALEGDLTEVGYELKARGSSLKGVLHVPRGGTPELAENARENEGVKVDGVKGPNGGVLQPVGDDLVEIVADQETGDVRVYVLDLNLKPVPIGEREIKLALTAGAGSEVITLVPGPDRLYFAGKLAVKVNPTKITVVLKHGGRTEVVLCGYRPGAVIAVGPGAPVIAILVAAPWVVQVDARPTVVVHDDHRKVIVVRKGKGKGKGKGKWRFK